MNARHGPPMTLGNAAAARVRLIVWCRDCRHQVEPDPDEMAERYGADMTVPDWHKRLVCSQCGSRRVDFVVTGETLRAGADNA
jgi:Zn finger protein HypA/HybF involved in hydrogenase expression